jgi:hypothetical protein
MIHHGHYFFFSPSSTPFKSAPPLDLTLTSFVNYLFHKNNLDEYITKFAGLKLMAHINA